ncbi:hypothetical protein Tco_1557164, partial [Tanacetum coccineum]
EEVAQQGQAPPLSPAYVPDPMELDEHIPVYVPEPEHPEYHVPSDDDIHVEDQPYTDDALPTTQLLGYIVDSESMEEDSIDYLDEPEDDDKDPEEDPSKEHDPEDDDEDPEEDPSEEHEPKDDDEIPKRIQSFEEDETAVTPPPRHRGARISVRPQTPMAVSTQALIDAFDAGSPLFPLPPTSLAYDQALLGHRASMIRMRDDIPEEDIPPRMRFVLTASPPGYDVVESSAAAAARPPRGQYNFIDTVEAGQALQSSEHRMMTSIKEVNLRVIYQAQINIVKGQRTAYETELHEVCQAYLSSEAQNRVLLARLKTLKNHMSRMEWQRQSAEDRAVRQMMRTHVLEARDQIDTVEDTGSSC